MGSFLAFLIFDGFRPRLYKKKCQYFWHPVHIIHACSSWTILYDCLFMVTIWLFMYDPERLVILYLNLLVFLHLNYLVVSLLFSGLCILVCWLNYVMLDTWIWMQMFACCHMTPVLTILIMGFELLILCFLYMALMRLPIVWWNTYVWLSEMIV
jgi:hypothetical protein